MGSLDPDGQVSSFTSTGNALDVVTAGSSIPVLLPGGRSDVWQGTSFASPIAAALAALLRAQHPQWKAAQVVARIQSTAADIAPLGQDSRTGWGELDARKALDGVCSVRCDTGAPTGAPDPNAKRPVVPDGLTIQVPYYLGRGHAAVATVEARAAGALVPGARVVVCVQQLDAPAVCRREQTTGADGSVKTTVIMSASPVTVTASGRVNGVLRTASAVVKDGLDLTIRTTTTSILVAAKDGTGQTASLWRWTGTAWQHVQPDQKLVRGATLTWSGLPTGVPFRLDVAAGGGFPAKSVNHLYTLGG